MGNSNKKKKTDISSKVGKEFFCPLCNKLFDSNTTFGIVL
jgi:transcription elongation factor Elf1